MKISHLFLALILLSQTIVNATSERATGYTPASEEVLHELRAMPRVSLATAGPSDLTADGFAELENIRSWPKELVYDQSTIGSCTANSMAFILRFLSVMNSNDRADFLTNPARLDPARLFHYWNSRFYEGKIYGDVAATKKDAGASMAGAILAMDKYGCCPEVFTSSLETWKGTDLEGTFKYGGLPYNVTAYTQQPTPEDYRFALDSDLDGINPGTVFAGSDTRTNPYASVAKNLQYQDLSSMFRKPNQKTKNTPGEAASAIMKMRAALAENKPVYIGLLLNRSFFKDKAGFIPTPSLKRFTPVGGHAIAIVGHGPYNSATPTKNYFKFINSWGPTWGDGGFGYLSDDYVGNINFFQIEAFAVSLLASPEVLPAAGAGKASIKKAKHTRKRGREKEERDD